MNYSVLDLKNFCETNDVLGYRLMSYGISDVMGSVCKTDMVFSSAIISEEFNVMTLRNEYGSATLMVMDEITMVNERPDGVFEFNIVCGLKDNYKVFKLYIRVSNNDDKDDDGCVCTRCNKKFNIYDTHNGLKIKKRFGYGSKFDGDEFDINICVDCLDELVSNKQS